MYCKFCGKQIPEGSAFCTFCGRSLKEVNPQADQAAKPAPQAPGQESHQPASEGETKPASGGSSWKPLFVVFLVIAVAVYCLCTFGDSQLVNPVSSEQRCIERLNESLGELQEIYDDLGLDCTVSDKRAWKREGCRFLCRSSIQVNMPGVSTEVPFEADFVVTKKSVRVICAKIEGIPCYQYLDGESLYYPNLKDDEDVDLYFWTLAQEGEIDGETIIVPDDEKADDRVPFSMSAYRKLEEGMTYPRVCTLFMESGTEAEGDGSGSKVLRWGSDTYFAELVFEEGRLVSKQIVRPE